MKSVIDLLLRYNFIAIFFILVVIASLLSENFLTFGNISNLFQQAAVVGIVAIGMTYVVLTGNIDLSVGSVVAMSGITIALLLDSGLHPALAVLITLGVGMGVGTLMGMITAFAVVPSFIVTLAGLVSFRGVTYLLSEGTPVGNLPKAFNYWGSLQIPLFADITFPFMGLVFILCCLVAGFIARYLVFGEYVYATGSNLEAARLSGIPTNMVITSCFAVSGLLASLGGILLTSRLRIGQPTAAQGLELDAIAAVVLGGTSLFGGRGGVLGTFFAVMLLQVLRNIFNLLGLGSFYQMTVSGIIIVAAILLNSIIDSRMGIKR